MQTTLDHPSIFTDTSAQHASTGDPILFGADPTERIVAVEPSEKALNVWQRSEDGQVTRTTEPFRPWLLLTAPNSILTVQPAELEGAGFRYLYEFESWSAYQAAQSLVRDNHIESLSYGNGSKQALIRSGKTLFKGMAMSDVARMQVDLETTSLSHESPDARILLIAVRDSQGLLDILAGDETDIVEKLVALVRERDPDIIEGHNIYGFDFPYLLARAEKLGIRLGLGRDGSEPRVGRPRNFAIGGNTRPFSPVWIYGRHVMDTYLAVQRFDWARGILTSYGLKEVARAFGIAEEDRMEMPRERLAEILQSDPQRVLAYARHDVIETSRLSEIVSPTEFYMAQMVPDSFGSSAVTGMGEKINSIFIRAYLSAGKAIPKPSPPRMVAGGYVEIRAAGVIDRVVKADVESLYPSIMLAERIKPANDTLNIFLPALEELTRRRLEAKAKVRSAEGAEMHYWDGLQGSFKVLINSFYGYLGASSFNFNDYGAAGRVTEEGRRLVVDIAAKMEADGCRVIEIDTDGVYFVPPRDVESEEAEKEYVARIGATLPAGIRLAFDGRYKAMVSLKTKNYVLQGYDGKMVYKGASLRSRADEKYGRDFLESAIHLLLDGKPQEVGELYCKIIDDILNHRIPIEKLARRERVTEKTRTSAQRSRSAAVAGETSVGDYITVYERSNGELGLLSDYEANERDENAPYYMDKLHKFACRLREAFEADFDRICPRPTARGIEPDLQTSLELF